MFSPIFTLLLLLKLVNCNIDDNVIEQCALSDDLKNEIASYQPFVDNLEQQIMSGNYKGSTYNELAKFVDTFGSRIAGSENLENAIDYMLNISKINKLQNVHGEEVNVTHWVRGNESAVMIQPRFYQLSMTGLGGSIGTPPEGIEAEVLAVESFQELEIPQVAAKAKGKIVLFVPQYVSYGVTVEYRDYAAARAAQHGAVASLVRSVTPFSLGNPHTGWQDYLENTTRIPTAAITVEDAHMIKRMCDRGDKVVIRLKMEAKNLDPAISRNTVVELVGREKPEQVVIVSGHLDSWDVGQGAMDDGGGVFISWNALVILKALGFTPRRTIRGIFWTAEEEGWDGAFGYAKAHKNETHNFKFMMESDEGTFNPYGIQYSAGLNGSCIIQEIIKLFKKLGITQLKKTSDVGPDITIWISQGIPGASQLNENEKYFWYHHSEADTMDVENSESLDKSTVLWASLAYIVADLSVDFPTD